MPLKDNTHFLREAERHRRETLRSQAAAAVAAVRDEGNPVTVAEIVRRSGVSRAFIYRQADLMDAINEARQDGPTSRPRPPGRERMTDASKQARIRQLTAANAVLREEMDVLRSQNAALLGELRTLRASGGRPVDS
jgi:hypothetical protein